MLYKKNYKLIISSSSSVPYQNIHGSLYMPSFVAWQENQRTTLWLHGLTCLCWPASPRPDSLHGKHVKLEPLKNVPEGAGYLA